MLAERLSTVNPRPFEGFDLIGAFYFPLMAPSIERTPLRGAGGGDCANLGGASGYPSQGFLGLSAKCDPRS